jgi:Mg2+ and Co2+ transporter CorA
MDNLNSFRQDQLSTLTDIHNMVCFSKKDSKRFWLKVCEAAEVEAGEPVSQDAFELALLTAKDILLEEGRRVFTRVKPRIRNNVAV